MSVLALLLAMWSAPIAPAGEPVVEARVDASAAVGIDASVRASTSPASADDAEMDARMKWWREARFGMFIHWGLYSEAAGRWNGAAVPGVGEWLLNNGTLQVADYESLRDRFNPVDFDAKAWVSLAQRAGMRYIVITSKHHDGFCLWPSELTEWDIASTPWGKSGRDPLGELYRECEAAGVRLCLYHSIMDWHHPDYLPRRAWDSRSADGAQFDRYREHLRGQLAELLQRYPNIGVLWFDGEWEETWKHEHGKKLYDWLRIQSPALIINNRIDKGRDGMAGVTRGAEFRGDFGTPEQEIPEHGFPEGVDWESCMTMNDTWGFKQDDHHWKSADTIIRMLADCASKGGNFLLNVGPDGRGRIPPESVERLEAVGRWLAPRGESIYGTHATALDTRPWGRSTQRTLDSGATRLYLFIFERPADGRLRLAGLEPDPTQARMLGAAASAAPLRTERDEDAVIVQLSEEALGPCPVVVLDLRGAAKVTRAPIIDARSSKFVDTVTVSLSESGDGRIIRYTLDGTSPTAASPESNGSITIERSCTVSARVFDGGAPKSATASRAFTKVAPQQAVERTLGPTPGLRASNFTRDRFEKVADIPGATAIGSLIVPGLSLEKRPRDEHFAIVFEGFLRVPRDGVWRFGLVSDDGARLSIGDRVIVDNDGWHVAQRRDGEVALAAGLHPIRVEYFNARGDRALQLDWEGPDQPRTIVPNEAFGWSP